jgi:Uma2 family endonuclease
MPPPATDRPEVDLPEKDRYTYEDYRQLPEGAPYELIRGRLAMSPAPTPRHQLVQANLFFELSRVVRDQEEGHVLSAPLDVRLSDTTVLQPDLVFIGPDRTNRIGDQAIEGAPDLVVEILSPASAHRDLTEKKRLYETHGVREYWVVDPDSETVEVFENADDGFLQAARAVEDGTISSTVIDGLAVSLPALFQ